MATGTAWRQWVETRDTYSPQLEHGRSISQALKSFDENLLAQRTAIWSVRATRSTRTIHPGQVDDARLSQLLESRAQERPLYDMFFINRFLVQNPREPVPSDAHRLLISKDAFQLLMSCCSVPPSFLFALSRYYYPNGRGFQRRHEESNNTNNNRSSSSVSSQWYFLPFRVQVPCTDMRDSHENTRTGRNQMNPFHYLHLPNQEVDIRGSQIAVYVEYNKHTDVTTAICVNFMDGRWRVLVEEPQTRILEALMHSSAHLGPMWIHLILFTTVTRWWNNSLHSVNEQLIAYELELQDKSEDASPPNIFYGNISKALHAMAAHVHRYGTEMDSIQSTTSEMAGLCLEALNGNDGVAVANFAQLSSQITATKSFVSELEKKIQNLLALVSTNTSSLSSPLSEPLLCWCYQLADYQVIAFQPHANHKRPPYGGHFGGRPR